MPKTKFKKMPAPKPAQIKAERIAAELTQAEAAAICQVGLRTFTDWERGRSKMHPIFWAWFLECAEITEALDRGQLVAAS